MLPVFLDIGFDMTVSVHSLVAIVPVEQVDIVAWSLTPKAGKIPKSLILTSDGLKIPGYLASNILAKRWQKMYDKKES
jgi:hypothetical protein